MLEPLVKITNTTRIVDLKIYPKIVKNIFFLTGIIKYAKRKMYHPNEWQNILLKPPHLLGFNTTGSCNARCVYCAYRFHKPDGVMEMQVYEKAVREFDEMGGGTIGLSTMTGEPLLDPYLMQRIEFAAQFESIQNIFFSSNGIGFKNKEIADNLFRASAKIKIKFDISLPGFEKTLFERVYGVGDYEEVLHGIENLLKMNKAKNNPLDINLILQPDRGKIFKDPDFINFILPHINRSNVMCSSRVENNWCGQIKQEHLTGEMILRRPVPEKLRNIPCQLLLTGHADVLVNGDIRACGCTYGEEGKHDSLVIGNIKENSLSEIWFGNERAKICERFLRSELPRVCQKCFMYDPY